MQNSYIKANHHPIPSGDFTLCYKEKPKNGIDFNYVLKLLFFGRTNRSFSIAAKETNRTYKTVKFDIGYPDIGDK